SLLANQRAREYVLDVQRRQPDPGARALSRKTSCDQARRDLDDSGSYRVDYLCGAGVGRVLVVDARARRWACSCADCAESGWDGSNGVALGVWLVLGRATVIAISHCTGAEREFGARGATGMGPNVSLVLELLAGSHRRDSFDPLVIRLTALE